MSTTAFALSPISARATSPTEADFEAIREAFVETARGRWFLEEYTRRNRNADTTLVLGAVARIERTLAAQKELKAEEPQTPPAPDLTETLAAIKAIVAAARDSAEAALSGPPMDEALAPARKCARVIREIAWGLRESGADGRICSLLDSQVEAINAACDQLPTGGFRDSILGAFDQAVANIDQLNNSAEIEAESTQQASAAVEEAPSASHGGSDNVVAFSSVTAATSSPAETTPANISLVDAAAETQTAPESRALEQEAAPVETMEAVTPAPSQADIAEPTETQDDVSSALQATETVPDFTTATPTDPEHAPLEAVAPQEAASEQTIPESGDGIALDESLFDLSAETTAQTAKEAEASAEVRETAANLIEPSAAIEALAEFAIETATTEETNQQTASTLEPEVTAAELEEVQQTPPIVTNDESSIVPQVVESLETMADVDFEETSFDAIADQNITFETVSAVAQDHLPTDEAPQTAERSEEEVFATSDMSEVAAVDAEQRAASDEISATPSEDAPSMAPDDVPNAPAKTPLPDIMIGAAVTADSYVTARMEAPAMEVAAATDAPAAVISHTMSLAADPTPDAVMSSASLGASLIANGIVPKLEETRNDPLAAVRRMSHAERIAFFS